MDNISNNKHLLDEQLKNIQLSVAFEPTYLILVASHLDPIRNSINKISCKQGVPLDGYVYDSRADVYLCECYDYLQVGFIPISMNASICGTNWSKKVPLAKKVIHQLLNDSQFRDVNKFESLFSPDEYSLEYIQLISAK